MSLILNPIFNHSGLVDPSGFCAFFGGSLKWGVILVRYPYWSGEGIVVPIVGRLDSGIPVVNVSPFSGYVTEGAMNTVPEKFL